MAVSRYPASDGAERLQLRLQHLLRLAHDSAAVAPEHSRSYITQLRRLAARSGIRAFICHAVRAMRQRLRFAPAAAHSDLRQCAAPFLSTLLIPRYARRQCNHKATPKHKASETVQLATNSTVDALRIALDQRTLLHGLNTHWWIAQHVHSARGCF